MFHLINTRALHITIITLFSLLCTNYSNAQCVPTIITGHRHVCIGDTTTLYDSTAGGRWSSSDSTVATIDSVSGLVRGMTAGYVTVTYRMHDTCGALSVTRRMFVDTVRTSVTITGPSYACQNQASWFSTDDTTGNGIWRSTGHTAYADPYHSGYFIFYRAVTDTIIYRMGTCRFGPSDSFVITARAAFDPGSTTGAGNICRGLTTVITRSDTFGSWVALYHPENFNNVTGVYNALHGGYEYFSKSLSDGFCTYSEGHHLYVDTVPVPVITGEPTVNIGVPSIFESGYHYGTWTISPATIATISAYGRVSGLNVGTAIITSTVTNACGTGVDTQTTTIIPPGIGFTGTSFNVFVNKMCSGPQFGFTTIVHSAPWQLRTYYGDGNCDTLALPASSVPVESNFYHNYQMSGSYTIKQRLYEGLSVIDSAEYTYPHLLCSNVGLSAYYDGNGNARFDGYEHANFVPIRLRVDSNSVPIDTIPLTSGTYYQAWGPTGSVYKFTLVDAAFSMSGTAGYVADTLSASAYARPPRLFGLSCGAAGFDLWQNSAAKTGRHHQQMTICPKNRFCTSASGTLTVNFDSRFSYYGASPAPSSTTAHSATWNIVGASAISDTGSTISLDIEFDGSMSEWLMPGQTLSTDIILTPTSMGDVDTTNNHVVRIDTVKSSYDPNMITVTPSGGILNGTTLHYMIEFENDGNDTAHNIYVLDTLPAGLDINTLQIEGATATMNTAVLRSDGYTIVKFDFPNIKLPDSSHHGHCTGNLWYNIKTYSGMADGTQLMARAGIYFDDNPVVMTPEVRNTIVIPGLTIEPEDSVVVCMGDTISFYAHPHTAGSTTYQWFKNAASVGTNDTVYHAPVIASGDIIKCRMITKMDDTVVSNSNVLTMTVIPQPYAGAISGGTTMCTGHPVTLTASGMSGAWSVTNAAATISATGGVYGVSAGLDTAVYTVTNYCGSATARHAFTVHTTLTPSVSAAVLPNDTLCEGTVASFTASIVHGGSSPRIIWRRGTTIVDSGLSYSYMPAMGDALTAEVHSNATCAIPSTAISAPVIMIIAPAVTPTINVYVLPNDTVDFIGQSATFHLSMSYGGAAPELQWFVNGTAVSGATGTTYTRNIFHNDTVYCRLNSNALCITDAEVNSNSLIMYVDHLYEGVGVQHVVTGISGLNLFPSPNNGTFTWSCIAEGTDGTAATYEVCDMTGKILIRGNTTVQAGVAREQLNMGDAAAGQYILRVITDGSVAVVPFTVAR